MHTTMKHLFIVSLLFSTAACTAGPVNGSVSAAEGAPILLADSDGRLLLLDIASGQEKVLSQPGIYRPADSIGPIHLWAPIRLSPDGQWLAVPQLDSQGTWSINLDGTTQIKLCSGAVNLVWSPDNRQIAFHDLNGASPETLYLQDVTGEEGARPLARLDGKILVLAWSPISSQIAVAYSLDPMQAQIALRPWEGLMEIALVSIPSGEIKRLAQVPAASTEVTAWDLAWSPDGREVWYLEGRISLPVDASPPRPLAAEPLPQWLTAETGEADPVLSPDGSRVAWVVVDDTQSGASLWLADIQQPETRAVIVEGLGPVAQLCWTQDGQAIVAAGARDALASVWRITPATGEATRLMDNVYFVGSLWDLQYRSTNIAVGVGLRPLPVPDIATSWPTYTADGLGFSFEYPPEWKIWDSSQMVTLSSVAFDRLGGWASLSPDDLLVTFGKIHVPSQDEWLNENVRSVGGRLQDVVIAGRAGLCWRQNTQAIREDCFVPLEGDAILVIHKYPADSLYDEVFRRIITSLQF